MTGDQRRGVYDGDVCALAQGTCLKEQRQMHPYPHLALYETVLGDGEGELLMRNVDAKSLHIVIARLRFSRLLCILKSEYIKI